MAKKNFKKGLNDLFDDALEDSFKEEKEVRTVKNAKNTKKSSKPQKSFASDLDLFLQDAIEESIKEHVEETKKKKPTRRKSKRSKPMFGLDSLIQQTVETSKIEAVMDGNVKRVTFTFDKSKLERLKKIARLEKAYVKDIVGELVSKYIDQYDSAKTV